MEAFRAAARASFALWGGRYNPIVIADYLEQAEELIDAFRVDFIVPLGNSEHVKDFPKKFPHLIRPFLHETVFVGDADYRSFSQVLDVYNTLAHLQDKRKETVLKQQGLRLYRWSPEDPLADVFLMQFGDYPSPEEIRMDCRGFLKHVSEAQEIAIDATTPLTADLFEHPSIPFISRYGIKRHYSVSEGWDTPGFYSGDVNNFDDLVCCWNLRAADIPLLFVDTKHLKRYGETVAAWAKHMHDMVSRRRHEWDRRVAVWVREDGLNRNEIVEELDKAIEPFKKEVVSSIYRVGDGTWNGLNLRPPTMYLGNASTLGVISTESGRPRISFSLDEKPFNEDSWFHTQHLVASLSFIGGLYSDEEHTLIPPFVPELNEFYARTMHFEYDKVRSESERIGLVIGACDKTAFINALPVMDLVERIFDLAGFSVALSAGGLIARQLIAQLGGVDGARAFKIPGVRRLLKTHGPMAAFTKKSALELIAGRDPDNPTASFKDYERLYGGHHPFNTKLEPHAVFAYLVEKGLFRMGAELNCLHCRMSSWTALDALKQRLVCEMCGREFDATRQLVDGAWRYRRSGVLGAERNAQGAIPVVMTLQQFKINLSSLRKNVYSPSLDLIPKQGRDLPRCEIDFVWVISEPYPEKSVVIIGECKDQGGQNLGRRTSTIDATDIEHLRCVADALPRKRFSTYIVLAKLCPFTAEEIELAKTLNDRYQRRTILLTARELEPYHFYERTILEFKDINHYGGTPEDLANNTAMMYFNEPERRSALKESCDLHDS